MKKFTAREVMLLTGKLTEDEARMVRTAATASRAALALEACGWSASEARAVAEFLRGARDTGSPRG